MSAAVKLALGVVVILIGLWLLLPAGFVEEIKPEEGISETLDWWEPFTIVVMGMIPPFLILIGILVVWIEAEEMRTPKISDLEMEVEEEE